MAKSKAVLPTHQARLRKRRGRYHHHERGRRLVRHALRLTTDRRRSGSMDELVAGRLPPLQLVTYMQYCAMLYNVTLELMITINWMERGGRNTAMFQL